MHFTIKKGATSRIMTVYIESGYGVGLAGLAYNTALLACYYHRNTSGAATAVTLVDMTLGTYTSSGFKEVDGTNLPGVYQFCPPDAAIAASAESVEILFRGVVGMLSSRNQIQLDDNTEKDVFDRIGALGAGLTAIAQDATVAKASVLGTPAGATIAADLVTIDNFVDDLEGRLTSARAGYLDNLSAGAVAQDSTVAKAAALSTVQADADDIQARLPAALVSGRMDASVGAYASGQAPLQPTVAGRTLDVSATGGTGIDWANVEAQSTTVNLSATTVANVVNITGSVIAVSRAINTKLAELSKKLTEVVNLELGKIRPAILDLQQFIRRGIKL